MLSKTKRRYLTLFIIAGLLLTLASLVSASSGETVRVSVSSDGDEGNLNSVRPSISADGRFVAFDSNATNLVSNDTNGTRGYDIFVHDRDTGSTSRVSVDSSGNEANERSTAGDISANGRFVVFKSLASNLVSDDTNDHLDIFVHDRATGNTTRVSVDSNGNEANERSDSPSISADGRYVAFASFASNLVSGDTNGRLDVFVRDLVSGTTERVSVDSNGNESNAANSFPRISGDGRYVAFISAADNLVSGDTNRNYDVFVHDRDTDSTTRMSIDSNGNEVSAGVRVPGTIGISHNGRFVAFTSIATDLVNDDTNVYEDIFVHDRDTGITTRVSVNSDGSEGNGDSSHPSVSGDGRYVAFVSSADNLVSNDTNDTYDVFVHDRVTGNTRRVSVDSDGNEGSASSTGPSINADGNLVAFQSLSNLVADDTNSTLDVYVHGTSSPANEPPVAVDDTVTTEEDTAVTIDVAANDSDPDGNLDPSSVSVTAQPSQGTATSNGNGTVTYSPVAGFLGGDSFDYEICDVGGLCDTATVDVTVNPANERPQADAGGPYAGDEGSPISLDGTGSSDPDGDPLTYAWSYTAGAGVDAGASCAFVDPSKASTTFTCTDDGTYDVTLTANDGTLSDSDTTAVTVANVVPYMGSIYVDQTLVPVNTAIHASANFSDDGTNDTHTAQWSWGDGNSSAGTVSETDGAGSVADNHSYANPGIYAIELTVTDDDGGAATARFEFVVVYDPDDGFVTGGGWFESPAGAYAADEFLTGRATFGFVAKYKRGANVPTGSTEFQFHAGELNFHSNDYRWLVVNQDGTNAQFRGSGTINGDLAPNGEAYKFMVWAADNADTDDTFRIKIWYEDGGEVTVYDNKVGQEPVDPIGGGNIMIHGD